MRVVVFGAGRMGQTRAQALADDPAVTDILIANRSAAAARELATRIGGRRCSLDEGSQTDMDAAIVTVATSSHLDILEPLIDRGVAILCEKPLTTDVDGTRQIVARADAAGSLLHVGYHRRFDAGFVAARTAIASGDLGSLYHLRMVSHDIRPSGEDYISTSGGIFQDLHVHDFDLASWLVDSPIRSVYATGSVRVTEAYGRFGDLDNTAIIAELTNGVPVIITGTRQHPRGQDVRVEVTGSRDSIDVGGGAASQPRPFPDPPDHIWPREAYTSFMDRFQDAFATETRAFIATVAEGTSTALTPGRADLEALRVAEACERSLREGRPIVLDEL